jgi:tetratricopeptide (TPR) repeat protein
MNAKFARSLSVLLTVLFIFSPAWATCGGGGGGGVGGMSGGGGGAGSAPEVYYVPWKVHADKDPAPASGLVLYWFPATREELQKSSMRASRTLSMYATQCIQMELAEFSSPLGQQLIGESKPPVAVLATPDGKAVNKVENTNGKLKVELVEKMVDAEVKQREASLTDQLKKAGDLVTAGDKDGAIKAYLAVAGEKCMFPKKAKDAQKELKKLGYKELAEIPAAPVLEASASRAIENTMRRGLMAEMRERYTVAEKYYSAARRMDPADPAPLRYLGELYRHHIGDWAKAREVFSELLNMPADSLSRAVALHGLGKMTIHDGDFKKGLSLMEQSIAEFPLPLTYRNLAVYWNSEGDPVKGSEYTEKALALDPKDPYNLVFAAVFMAQAGRTQEALKIARQNINLMPASYNLAAIFAQAGEHERALTLLKRHFFRYERYQAVREKEMMEARVDAVFESVRDSSAFLALTSGADGKLPMPMKSMGTPARENQR